MIHLNLYSSMDRLETLFIFAVLAEIFEFIFQYGQIRNSYVYWISQCFITIYIPVWIDQKPVMKKIFIWGKTNLYSSMDRLETIASATIAMIRHAFIFQYGQIRNFYMEISIAWCLCIYIPVWIDQKLFKMLLIKLCLFNLYSSMDRLETSILYLVVLSNTRFIFQYGQIRNI